MKIYKGRLSDLTLTLAFTEALKAQNLYTGLLIETKGSPSPELIINESPNFEIKLEYLKSAYDERLRLKSAPDKIRITAIMAADRLSDFRYLLKTR